MRSCLAVVAAALAVVLAAPARAGTPDAGTPVAPTVTVPKLDLGGDLAVPDTSGMSGDAPKADAALKSATKVTYRLVSTSLAEHFDTLAGKGCVTKSKLDGFRLAAFPGNVEPFDLCLRLSSTAGVVAHLSVRIVSPTGHEVASADGEVSFAGQGKTVDYVVSWRGFPARRPGTYRLEVRLGGAPVGDASIVVGRARR